MSRSVGAPRGFTPEEKKLWRRWQQAARDQGTWKDEDAPLLELLVTAAAAARRYRKLAEEEPAVEGSKGQLVANPLFAEAKKCDDTVLKFATVLLLTPQARQRAGIEGGGAADPADPFASVLS